MEPRKRQFDKEVELESRELRGWEERLGLSTSSSDKVDITVLLGNHATNFFCFAAISSSCRPYLIALRGEHHPQASSIYPKALAC